MRILSLIVVSLTLVAAAHSQESAPSQAQRAFASLRQEYLLPCDTWVALPDATASGATILAKNSDRTVFDCQPLLLHPRQTWPDGAEIDLGRTQVPQVAETYATLGSSPYWCWGYEEGINEFGVAIGNEGIFTRARAEAIEATARGEGPDLGPTGMDLMRLTLERSRTAREAVETLGALLEEHGQFGSGMPQQPTVLGAYDNSYIVADAGEAWVVETCGKRWIARRFDSGTTSISNTLTIGADWDLASSDLVEHAIAKEWWPAEKGDAFDFLEACLDASPQMASPAQRARTRAACSSGLLQDKRGEIDPSWMMRVARDRSTTPSLDLDVTASSCVAVLPAGEGAQAVFWWCASVPSNACFVPFFVASARIPETVSSAGTVGRNIVPPSRVAQDEFAPGSYWWRFRALSDLVRVDYTLRNPIVRGAFDPLEEAFEAGLDAVVAEAAALRSEGRNDEAAAKLQAYSNQCVDRVLATLAEVEKKLQGMEVVVPEALLPFIGRYAKNLGGQDVAIEVLAQDGKLTVRLPDGRLFELLEPDAEGRWFFALTDQASVSFVQSEEGPATSMTLHQPGAAIELPRETDG